MKTIKLFFLKAHLATIEFCSLHKKFNPKVSCKMDAIQQQIDGFKNNIKKT